MKQVKQYPLDLKILQTLAKFKYADINGLLGAVEKEYSIFTLRRTLKKLENINLIYSVRDSNKYKVYSLTDKGEKYVKEVNINFNGLDDISYYNICLKWSNFMGGKTTISNLPSEIDAFNVSEENELSASALIIENEKDTSYELLDKIETIANKEFSLNLTKIYVVIFNSINKNSIPQSINNIVIEVFEGV